jgi:hypothetical protein
MKVYRGGMSGAETDESYGADDVRGNGQRGCSGRSPRTQCATILVNLHVPMPGRGGYASTSWAGDSSSSAVFVRD